MGHPEHAMSAALHSLQPGASVAVKGPFGTFRYQPGKYKAIGEPPPATAPASGVPALLHSQPLCNKVVLHAGWCPHGEEVRGQLCIKMHPQHCNDGMLEQHATE